MKREKNKKYHPKQQKLTSNLQPIRLNKYHIFSICSFLLAVMLAVIMSNNITEPFIEMHSWGRAHDAWVARSHVVYGLGYTKGFDTFAVGNPPEKKPTRYLDHPVLFTLLNAAAMAVLGTNEWSLRVMNIISTIAALLLFLKILRHLADDVTALLAGLFFCIFPLIAFFGVNMWLYPLAFLAFWCYLALIGTLKNAPPKKWHKPVLALSIFFAIQMTWEGFFFAMAIGIHYICHCLRRKKWPDWVLFAVLSVIPFLSLAADFTVLAAGHNWDFDRLFELAKIRATHGELGKLTWTRWFGRFTEHAMTNFSLPVIIVAIIAVTIGQIYAFTKVKASAYSLKFPQFWLFFMPALFQLTLLRGTLWPHQYWERPLAPVLAIAAALAIMTVYDIVKKLNRIAAVIASIIITALLCASCAYGISYYYGIRWQSPERMEMFKYLNTIIPPDKSLLSLESHIIDQFPGIKAASYRPEIAWHLDRDIVVAGNIIIIDSKNNVKINIPQALADIENKAETGEFTCYLAPMQSAFYNPKLKYKTPVTNMAEFLNTLARRYPVVKTYPYVPWKTKKPPWLKQENFYQRGMLPHVIFDLNSTPEKQNTN